MPKIFHFFPLLLLVACSQTDKTFTNADSAGFTGKITGVATDRRGSALSGVLITVNPGGQTTVSAADGSYEISTVSPGNHLLSFIKADYRDTVTTDSVNIDLLDSLGLGTQSLTYRYATVKGSVVDSSGTDTLREGGVAVEEQTASASALSGSFEVDPMSRTWMAYV
ncbi:MAG TPA: carboxypeptidase-like regulatory domain-containing protein [Fibrobacteraceae bacterium]|nr:carboxypeptidase-like regulatory domain-containing protein [Fibrobacteraceae bacterium]